MRDRRKQIKKNFQVRKQEMLRAFHAAEMAAARSRLKKLHPGQQPFQRIMFCEELGIPQPSSYCGLWRVLFKDYQDAGVIQCQECRPHRRKK